MLSAVIVVGLSFEADAVEEADDCEREACDGDAERDHRKRGLPA
jgi:hypothetical protein